MSASASRKAASGEKRHVSAASAPSASNREPGEPDGDEVTHVHSAAGARRAPIPKAHEAAQTAASVIGRTIEGKYCLDDVIGTGGMGSVYRARRLLIGDQVAIKLLHHAQLADPEASERFRREAQAAARLKHPNAVSIYDFGVTNDGLHYLVMELAEGQSLRRVIKEQGPLAPAVAAEIITQVCAALDEAHRQQIVHRDLKPDNILVNAKITALQVKVLDFGIAKLRDVTASNLTQAGNMMGTPRYMSPEQCLGEELDNRSDIYSLGIVLYEMLVGVVPFNAQTSNAVVIQQVNEPPPPLRAINRKIAPTIEDAVLHALAKARESRPQTARAFAAEFSAAVEAAGAPVADQVSQKYSPAAAGLNPTVVLRHPSTGSAPRQMDAPPVPHAKRNSGFWIPLILVGALLLAVGVIVGLLVDASNRAKENRDAAATPSQQNDQSADNRTAGQSSPATQPERSPSQAPENVPATLPRVEQPAPPVNIPPRLPDAFQRAYRGRIGKQPLSLTLVRSGRTLGGTASTSSSDRLSGTIENNGSFTLYGYEHGGPLTGIYRGRVNTDGSVSGSWSTPNGQKRTSFSARQE